MTLIKSQNYNSAILVRAISSVILYPRHLYFLFCYYINCSFDPTIDGVGNWDIMTFWIFLGWKMDVKWYKWYFFVLQPKKQCMYTHVPLNVFYGYKNKLCIKQLIWEWYGNNDTNNSCSTYRKVLPNLGNSCKNKDGMLTSLQHARNTKYQ